MQGRRSIYNILCVATYVHFKGNKGHSFPQIFKSLMILKHFLKKIKVNSIEITPQIFDDSCA